MSHPANARLFLSEPGLNFIKHFETFCPRWYLCPAGVLTIGYGHTQRPGDNFALPMSADTADALLRKDVQRYAAAVREYVDVPLQQHEFDALVSFTFNVGRSAFKQSTLLRLLNNADKQAAAEQFPRWVYSKGKKLNGLVRRRRAVKKMFLSGVY